MDRPLDFRELLEEFAREGVEHLIVGGYAFYARPRATKDLDILLRAGPGNLEPGGGRARSFRRSKQRRLCHAIDGRCRDRPSRANRDDLIAVNPRSIVEVLSDSTEDRDRGEKLEHFNQIPWLRECLLVSHRTRQIDLRAATATVHGPIEQPPPGDTVDLHSIRGSLRVDEIHRRGLGSTGP
jgi:Uma2 family endonuclease